MLTADLLAFPAIVLAAFIEGEVAILGASVLSTLGGFHTWTVFLAGFLGTVLGDQLVYWIGRAVRDPSRAKLFGKHLVSPLAAQRVQRFYARHGVKTVLGLRFAFGVRTAGYFLAGAGRMRAWKFTAADATASLLYAAGLTLLGVAVGRPLIAFFEGYGLWTAAGVTAGVLGVVLFVVWIQKRLHAPRLP